ncbi:CBS domain-containing protein [Streptomyces mayteni]
MRGIENEVKGPALPEDRFIPCGEYVMTRIRRFAVAGAMAALMTAGTTASALADQNVTTAPQGEDHATVSPLGDDWVTVSPLGDQNATVVPLSTR